LTLKETKYINNFIITFILFLIIMIALSFYQFDSYIKVYGEVNDQNISIYLSDKELSSLEYKLKYKDVEYNFEIVDITNNYMLNGNKLVRNVKIKSEFSSKDYIVELYLKESKRDNIYGYIYSKYMKGD
jgi:hypothetical protein